MAVLSFCVPTAACHQDHDEDLSNNLVLRFSKKLVRSTDQYDEDKFFTVQNGKRLATPLLLCLICIEVSDFVFAVDSIPAVLGVSKDTFIVYTSNVFAIMGLRSL
jgi:tellurite resistance protein TerC